MVADVVRDNVLIDLVGDYLLVGTAVTMIVLIALALGFVLNRLEGVARALPILQGLLMVCSLIALIAVSCATLH